MNASVSSASLRAPRRSIQIPLALLAVAIAITGFWRTYFGPLFAGVMSVDGTLLEANRLSLEACGYTKDEVIGKKFWECAWWSPSPDLMETIKAASAPP